MMDTKNVKPVVYRESIKVIEAKAFEFWLKNGFWAKRDGNLNLSWDLSKIPTKFPNNLERNKWCAKYIRHNLTNYDQYLKANGIVKDKDGNDHPRYYAVKRMFMEMTKLAYPKYFTPMTMGYGMAC